MRELPTIELVVGIIGEDDICRDNKRPWILIHLDGRVYRGIKNKEDLSLSVGDVVSFYTEGDDEPFGATLRGFDEMKFLTEAEGTELEPLWRNIHKVS